MSGMFVGVSDVLALELHATGDWFRFLDPVTGEYLPDSQERRRAQEAAEARTEAAEAQITELEAELRRLRGQ